LVVFFPQNASKKELFTQRTQDKYFLHPLNRNLLNAYYMLVTVLHARDIAINKTDEIHAL
jgi:hypothetical protein